MKLRKLFVAVTSMAIIFMAATAQAVDGDWKPQVSGNWSDTSKWVSGVVPGTNPGDTVSITNNITTATTVTINTTPRIVGTLNIGESIDNSHVYTLAANGGGTLTFDNSGGGAALNEFYSLTDVISAPIILADNLTATVNGGLTLSGIISESGGAKSLTKSGGGTLTLSGANTYSGGFTLNAGIFGSIGSGTYNGFGTGTVTVNGGRFLFGSGANATITNAMNWKANFTVDRGASSTPTLNWNGAITLGANVTVGGSAAGGGYIQIFNGGILDDATGGRSISFTTIGTGGRDYITLNGNNTYTGNTSIDKGSLTIGGSGRLGGGDYSGNISISTTADAPITYSSSSDQILRGVISGVSGLTKNTSSTSVLTLYGANTFAGNTTISAGTLKLGAAGVIPDGAGKGNVTVDGKFDLNAFSETINGLSGSGTIDTVAGGTPTLTVGANNQTSVFSGIITNTAGSLALTKTGTGTLTLSGDNNYSGLTTVSDGTVIVAKPSTMGGLTIVAGKTFLYAPATAGALNINGAYTLGSATAMNTVLGGTPGQSALTVSGAASLSGTGVVNIRLIPGVAPAAGTHNLITAASGLDGAAYTFGKVFGNTDFTLSNFSRSATAISVDVAAATPLSGNVYWKGGLSGNTGVWSASDGSGTSNWQIPDGTPQGLVPGATADLVFSTATTPGTMVGMTLGANMSVKSLTINNTATAFGLSADGNTLTLGTGGITLGAGVQAVTIAAPVVLGADQTWTIGGSNVVNMNSAVVSGSGGLTKNGSGTLVMGSNPNAAHTYSGTTTINGGLVRFSSNLPAASGLTLNGGVYEDYWTFTFSRTLGAGAGQVQILGGASGFSENGNTGMNVILNNNAASEVVWGSAFFNPSTLVLQAATAQNGSTLNFQNKIDLNAADRTVAVNATSTATATISGVIRTSSGTAGIIKTGVGKLILSAANTYNGDTTVSAGTLQLNNVNTSNQNSTVTIAASGATLYLNFGTLTNTVDKLFIGTTQKDPGVYGSADLAQITGTGKLKVKTGQPKGTIIQLK